MVLPLSNEGYAILPNRAGEKTTALNEWPTNFVGGSTLPLDVSGQANNTNFTVGKPDSGADILWSALNNMNDSSLVHLTGRIAVLGAAATTEVFLLMFTQQLTNPFMEISTPLTNGQGFAFATSTLVVMDKGLIDIRFSIAGGGQDPTITAVTIRADLGFTARNITPE